MLSTSRNIRLRAIYGAHRTASDRHRTASVRLRRRDHYGTGTSAARTGGCFAGICISAVCRRAKIRSVNDDKGEVQLPWLEHPLDSQLWMLAIFVLAMWLATAAAAAVVATPRPTVVVLLVHAVVARPARHRLGASCAGQAQARSVNGVIARRLRLKPLDSS